MDDDGNWVSRYARLFPTPLKPLPKLWREVTPYRRLIQAGDSLLNAYPNGRIEYFDMNSQQWELLSSTAPSDLNQSEFFAYDSKLFFLRIDAVKYWLSSYWIAYYDLKLRKWATLPAPPDRSLTWNRGGDFSLVQGDGKIYLITSRNPLGSPNSILEYDIATNVWSDVLFDIPSGLGDPPQFASVEFTFQGIFENGKLHIFVHSNINSQKTFMVTYDPVPRSVHYEILSPLGNAYGKFFASKNRLCIASNLTPYVLPASTYNFATQSYEFVSPAEFGSSTVRCMDPNHPSSYTDITLSIAGEKLFPLVLPGKEDFIVPVTWGDGRSPIFSRFFWYQGTAKGSIVFDYPGRFYNSICFRGHYYFLSWEGDFVRMKAE